MDRECCKVSVTETEQGFRIDVSGESVKASCKDIFRSCCGEELKKKCFGFSCESGK